MINGIGMFAIFAILVFAPVSFAEESAIGETEEYDGASCTLYCEYGFDADENGNTICKCMDGSSSGDAVDSGSSEESEESLPSTIKLLLLSPSSIMPKDAVEVRIYFDKFPSHPENYGLELEYKGIDMPYHSSYAIAQLMNLGELKKIGSDSVSMSFVAENTGFDIRGEYNLKARLNTPDNSFLISNTISVTVLQSAGEDESTYGEATSGVVSPYSDGNDMGEYVPENRDTGNEQADDYSYYYGVGANATTYGGNGNEIGKESFELKSIRLTCSELRDKCPSICSPRPVIPISGCGCRCDFSVLVEPETVSEQQSAGSAPAAAGYASAGSGASGATAASDSGKKNDVAIQQPRSEVFDLIKTASKLGMGEITDVSEEKVENKTSYKVETSSEKKILGLFKVKVLGTIIVDAETKQVRSAKKPWWHIFAF